MLDESTIKKYVKRERERERERERKRKRYKKGNKPLQRFAVNIHEKESDGEMLVQIMETL